MDSQPIGVEIRIFISEAHGYGKSIKKSFQNAASCLHTRNGKEIQGKTRFLQWWQRFRQHFWKSQQKQHEPSCQNSILWGTRNALEGALKNPGIWPLYSKYKMRQRRSEWPSAACFPPSFSFPRLGVSDVTFSPPTPASPTAHRQKTDKLKA